jgi:hypothetical protein
MRLQQLLYTGTSRRPGLSTAAARGFAPLVEPGLESARQVTRHAIVAVEEPGGDL